MKGLIVFVFLVVASNSFAAGTGNVERRYADLKLPTQQVLEKQTITDPAAAGTTNILNASAGNTSSAAATITTFAGQPDVPRNLVITPGGTTADVAACTLTVTGKNFFNSTITETFAFADNASTATTGNKAFKTVTSVLFPANCEDSPYSATWSIGYGEKLGLKRCMASAGHLVFSTVAGAYESTRATVAVSATAVESNTADFNGTMNGSNDFEAFFLQNYGCFP